MLRWIVVFTVVAVVAAVVGFGGVVAGLADIAKFIFIAAMVLAVALLFASSLRRA